MNTINLNSTSFEVELSMKALRHELKQVQLSWFEHKLELIPTFRNLELCSAYLSEYGQPDMISYLNCTSNEQEQVQNFWFSELKKALRGEYNLKQAQMNYIEFISTSK